jgi:hypothetical protein
MEDTVELSLLLRQMGYSEAVVAKIVGWYLKDHPELSS